MSLETAISIKNSELCRYDSLDGFLSFFSDNGDVDGWDIYNDVYMYNSWNGILFGRTYEESCYIERTNAFDYIPCETYYNVKIAMKIVPEDTTQGEITKGRLQWITIEDNLWDTDRLYDFDIYNDGKWHIYNLNMGPHKYWIGNVNNLRLYPFIDAWSGDFFAIERISISSVNSWDCLNKSCSYYIDGNYSHSCTGVGSKGSCMAGESKTSYDLESGVSDELIINIDGYGEEKFDLGNCADFDSYEMCRRLAKHISGLDIGGYAYCNVEVDEFDRDQIKILSGTFNDDSSVEIIDSPAARELGFFSAEGEDISIKEIGTDPASGFDFKSSRLLTSFEITRIIDGTIDSSSYLHNPSIYSTEVGRRDYSETASSYLTNEYAGGFLFTHPMGNSRKTLIDVSNPVTFNGKLSFIYAVGKVCDNAEDSKIKIYRPYKDGTFEEVFSIDISEETDSEIEFYSADCDVLVNRGDVIGAYNIDLCIPSITAGKPDATFYHVAGEATSVFDPGDLYIGGNSGFSVYARSDRKQSSVILGIDLGKRINIEKFNVYGVKNDYFEYNVSSCKDFSWVVDTHSLTHTHKHKNGDIAHDNLAYGEEALNDNITIAQDPYTNLTFGVGDDGYWTSGTHTYCYVNGDNEFFDPGVGGVYIGDYRANRVTWKLEFPNETNSTIHKSKIYFKEEDNLKGLELSYYLGSGSSRGNISSGDNTYKKLNYTLVKKDGQTLEVEPDEILLRGFYNNPFEITGATWRLLEHRYDPIAVKGFRIDSTYHLSTKLTEIEIYSLFEEDTPLTDISYISFSSYGDVWATSDFEKDYDVAGDVVEAGIANSPRYLIFELNSRAVFNLNFIETLVGSQVKLEDCSDELLLEDSKTNVTNDSTAMILENIYDRPFDLTVDIPKQTINTDTVLLWNKLGSQDELDDSEVGPACVLNKRSNYKFLDKSSLCMKENECYGLKNLVGGKTAYSRSNEAIWVDWPLILRTGIDVDYGSEADYLRNDLTFDDALYKYYKIYAFDTTDAGQTSIINAVGVYFNGGEADVDKVRINVGNNFDDVIRYETDTQDDRTINFVPVIYDNFVTGSGTAYKPFGSVWVLWEFEDVNIINLSLPLNSFELRIDNFTKDSAVLFYDDNDNILATILPRYYTESTGYGGSVMAASGDVMFEDYLTHRYITCALADDYVRVRRMMGYFGIWSGDKELYEVDYDTPPDDLPSDSNTGFIQRPFYKVGFIKCNVELDSIPSLGPYEEFGLHFSTATGLDEIRLYTRSLDTMKYGVYAGNTDNDYICLGTSDYESDNLAKFNLDREATNEYILERYTRGYDPVVGFLPWVTASTSGSDTFYVDVGGDRVVDTGMQTYPGAAFCNDTFYERRFWISGDGYPHWIKYDFGKEYKKKIEKVEIIFGQKSMVSSNQVADSDVPGTFYKNFGGCPAELYIQGSDIGDDEAASWTTVYHTTSITPSNVIYEGSYGGISLYSVDPVTNIFEFTNEIYYRFYRVYMTTEQVDSEIWVTMYQLRLKETFPGPGSLFDAAYGKPVVASNSAVGYPPEKANDANMSTYWSSVSGTNAIPAHWYVDVGDITPIKKISVALGFYEYAYSLFGGVDNTAPSDNTWSRVDNSFVATAKFSQNDLHVETYSGWQKVRAVFGMMTGKWYWEVNLDAGRMMVGVENSAATINSYPGVDEHGWGFYYNYNTLYHDGLDGSYPPAVGARTNPIGVAVDLDAGKLWFRISDEWNGDPVAGTDPAYDNLTVGEIMHPAVGMYYYDHWSKTTTNFGATDFVYEVPAGFNTVNSTGWKFILKESLGSHSPTYHDDLEDLEYRYVLISLTDTDHPTNASELLELNVVPYGVDLTSTSFTNSFAIDLGQRYAIGMVRNYGTDAFRVAIGQENTIFSSSDTNDVNNVVWAEEQSFIDYFNDNNYLDNWVVESSEGSSGGILVESGDAISVHDYGLSTSDTITSVSGIAKSVVFEFVDNYGSTSMGIRAIDFKFEGELIDVIGNTISDTYASTIRHGNFAGWRAFSTSLSKIGTATETSWQSVLGGVNTDQWLSIVFDYTIKFDEIVINNNHSSGSNTDMGVKNTKIYVSSDEIRSHTYGDPISNSVKIFDGVIDEHVASNVVDDQLLDTEEFSVFTALTVGSIWYGPTMTYSLDELVNDFNLDITFRCGNNDGFPNAGSYVVDFLYRTSEDPVITLKLVNPANGEIDNVFTEYLYDNSEPSGTTRVERWGENSVDHYRGLGLMDDRTMRNYYEYRDVNYENIVVGGNYQACIKFDLSAIEGVEILEAKLFMRVSSNNGFSGPGDYKDVGLYRLYKPWISTDVCWYYYSSYDGDLSWGTNGAWLVSDYGIDDGVHDRSETPFATQRVYQLEYETWFSWDLTDIVSKWVSGEIKNYGFLAGLETTTYEPLLSFYNSRSVDGYRPYLEIKYKTNGLVYADNGEMSAYGTTSINLERAVSTSQLVYKINNISRYVGDITTDPFDRVRVSYGRYNTDVDYQRPPAVHNTSYFELYSATEAADVRWIRFDLDFDGFTTQYVKRIGIYPDISVNTAPGGGRNCEWENLGDPGKLLTSSYINTDINYALMSHVSSNYSMGDNVPEKAVDGFVDGAVNPGWAFDYRYGSAPYIIIDFGKEINLNYIVLHHGPAAGDKRYDNYITTPYCGADSYKAALRDYRNEDKLPSNNIWDNSPLYFTFSTSVSGNDDWVYPWITGRAEQVGTAPATYTIYKQRYTEEYSDRTEHKIDLITARRLKVVFSDWDGIRTPFYNTATDEWEVFRGSYLREVEVFNTSAQSGKIYSEQWPILAFDLRYMFKLVNIEYDATKRSYRPTYKYSGENYSDPHKVSFDKTAGDQLYASTDSSEVLKYFEGGYFKNLTYRFDSDVFLSAGSYAITFDLYNIEDIDTMYLSLQGNTTYDVYPTQSGTLSGTGTWLSFEESVYIDEDSYFGVFGAVAASGTGVTENDEWGIRYPAITKTTSLRKRWLSVEADQDVVGTTALEWIKAYSDDSFVLTEYSLWWDALVSDLSDSIFAKVGNTALKIEYPNSSKVDVVKYFGSGIGKDLEWHVKDSLCFWLYISNINKIDLDTFYVYCGKSASSSDVEGEIDAYYVWKVSDVSSLSSGWNRVKLPFDEYISYIPASFEAGPKTFLASQLDFAFNGSPFSLFQMEFSGKGEAFELYLDDVGINRNIFDDDVKFGKGLCLVNFESLELPLSNVNLSRGTIEFWFKSYTTAQGRDLFNRTFSRNLFSLASTTNSLSLGILAAYGFQITVSQDVHENLKHIVDIPYESEFYFGYDDVIHLALVWDNTGTFIAGSKDTLRLYYDSKLMYSSTDKWDVFDSSPSLVRLGGSPKGDCYESDAFGSGMFENVKIYNYCRTAFDSTVLEDVKNTYTANDFVEISDDDINFHGSSSSELPLVFENVPVSGTRTVYVRSSKDDNFSKSRGLTADVYVEWEVSV